MRKTGASDRKLRQISDRETANDYEVFEYRGGVTDAGDWMRFIAAE